MTASDTAASAESDRQSPSRGYDRTRFSRWFRWHLAASLAVFFASAFAGYAILGALPIESLQELVPADSPLPEFGFVPIMLNNLRVLVMVLLGSVTLWLISLLVLAVNGLMVGGVVAIVVQQTSWTVILAALLPHGIIELSAFFVAASISLRVTHRLIRYGLGYDETPLTRTELKELAVLVVVLALLIVVAAWIEVNVTPWVLEQVTGSTEVAA